MGWRESQLVTWNNDGNHWSEKIIANTWDIKPFVPWTKSDFLKSKQFDYVSDFARCKKLRTKTDFDLVIVEGSRLGTKSDYNCRRKSRKKFEYIVRE